MSADLHTYAPHALHVLILAPVITAELESLAAALRNQGLAVVCYNQAGEAFAALVEPDGSLIGAAIILDGVSGLAVPVLAQALRGLPGRAHLPLLIEVGQFPVQPPCLFLPRPYDALWIGERIRAGAASWPPPSLPQVAGGPLAVFDPQPLRRVAEAAPAAVRQLASILLRDLGQARETWPRLLVAGELALLRAASHKLKGSSGSLGAPALAACCAQLEAAARAGDELGCSTALAPTLAAMDQLEPQLQPLAEELAD